MEIGIFGIWDFGKSGFGESSVSGKWDFGMVGKWCFEPLCVCDEIQLANT